MQVRDILTGSGPYKRRLSKYAATPPRDLMEQPIFGRYAQYDAPAAPRKPSHQNYLPPESQHPQLRGGLFSLPALNAPGAFNRQAQAGPSDTGLGLTGTVNGGLESALAALQGSMGPRWVNGQRVSVDHTNIPGPMDDADGGVPFPLQSGMTRGRPRMAPPLSLAGARGSTAGLGLSLGTGMGYDPFSRAVSPIRDSPHTARPRINIDLPLTSGVPSQYTSPISAPAGPSQLHGVSHDVFGPKINTVPLPDGGPMKALKRIHRPNLRTLISPGISREPSPVDIDPAAPVPGGIDGRAMVGGTPISSNTSGLPTFFAEQISPAQSTFGDRPWDQSRGAGAGAGGGMAGLRPYVREQMQMQGRSGTNSPVLFAGELRDRDDVDFPL